MGDSGDPAQSRPKVGRVTVIATCYNHEAYVRAALESISSQGYADTQIIVCDDSSQDASPRIIASWAAQAPIPPVLLLQQSNRGLIATLREALSLATGEWMMVISTDDLFLPGRIALQVGRASALPATVALEYTDVMIVDEAARVCSKSLHARQNRASNMPQGWVLADLLKENFVPGPSVIYRTAAVRAVGGFDEDSILDDYDLLLRLADRYEFAYSAHPAVAYRVHRTSASRTQALSLAGAVGPLVARFADRGGAVGHAARWRLGKWAADMYRMGHPAAREACLLAWRKGHSTQSLVLLALLWLRLRFDSPPLLAVRWLANRMGIRARAKRRDRELIDAYNPDYAG